MKKPNKMITATRRDTGISGILKKNETMHIHVDRDYRNVAYLLLTEVGTKALSLLCFVIMARGLSKQSYGIVALAFSVGSLFYIFFNIGLENHIIRDIKYLLQTKTYSALQELASTVATIKIWLFPVFSIILGILSWAMGWWNTAYLPVIFLIFSYFYLSSVIQLILFFFRAFENMAYEFVVRIAQGLMLIVVTLLFGYFYKNILFLSVGYVVMAMIAFFGIFAFFIKKTGLVPSVSRRINKREITLVGKTKYLFLTSICTSVFSSIDILIISHLRGVEDVAIYKNAVMITLALFLIPTAIVQGFYPKLVQHKVKLDEFFKTVKKILLRLIPLGMGVAAIFALAGSQLIVAFFGKSYIASIPLFRISLIAFLFATINQVLGYGMIAIGKYKEYFIITFIVSIVSVLLNSILISKIGLMGGVITLNTTHLLLIILPITYLYFSFIQDKRKQYNTI